MLLDGASELLADIMTANRSLSGIPSASAILDTSNYTFHAISYGKDADGFRNHAHRILSPSSDGIIKVVSYQGTGVLSYQTSATAVALQEIYKLLPQSINPIDTRLERKSTLPNYSSGVVDSGQCLNSIINANLQSKAHLIGCFPAATGTDYWVVSSADNPAGSVIYSGTIAGIYNTFNIMDSSGFLTFAPGSAQTHKTYLQGGVYYFGALRSPISVPNKVTVAWFLPPGDAAGLLLFGGVYHLGLWYLDLKEMLKQGYYPPYSFNSLNNTRKYKLFAKKTFSKDLLYLNDVVDETIDEKSGFKYNFQNETTRESIYYSWDLYFT